MCVHMYVCMYALYGASMSNWLHFTAVQFPITLPLLAFPKAFDREGILVINHTANSFSEVRKVLQPQKGISHLQNIQSVKLCPIFRHGTKSPFFQELCTYVHAYVRMYVQRLHAHVNT